MSTFSAACFSVFGYCVKRTMSEIKEKGGFYIAFVCNGE
ncbi:MAG: hypothetical protein K0R34_3778 [Herbinix sp.]|jgi:hypothetical protein|nr:hypothetical protein [Herbinix sp.]